MSRTYRKDGYRNHQRTGNSGHALDRDFQRLPPQSFRRHGDKVTRDWEDERGYQTHGRQLRLANKEALRRELIEFETH